MPRGIPTSTSRDTPVPLRAKRLKNVPLVKLCAFRTINEREDRETGEKYEVDQVKLAFYFDSGLIQRNSDGEPILDNAGDTQAHLVNDGFVTYSGHPQANLPTILRALGFSDERFINDEGGLTEDAAESIEVMFGTNGLGDDYSSADWMDLPLYTTRAKGGKVSKGDLEVPVTSFKIMGYELLGRRCDMALSIKNDYNRIETYLEPEDPEPLDDAPKPKVSKGIPADVKEPDVFVGHKEAMATKAASPDDTPPLLQGNAGEPEPETKRAIYVTKRLQESNVPGLHRLAVVRAMIGNPDLESIYAITTEDAKKFKEMFTSDPTSVVAAYNFVIDQAQSAPTEEVEEDDDFDEEDDI